MLSCLCALTVAKIVVYISMANYFRALPLSHFDSAFKSLNNAIYLCYTNIVFLR